MIAGGKNTSLFHVFLLGVLFSSVLIQYISYFFPAFYWRYDYAMVPFLLAIFYFLIKEVEEYHSFLVFIISFAINVAVLFENCSVIPLRLYLIAGVLQRVEENIVQHLCRNVRCRCRKNACRHHRDEHQHCQKH